MLVVFGANGRTGSEVVKEAIRRGIEVRAIARSDRDVSRLNKALPIRCVSYADADHPASLGAVLQGATQIISCIDPRTAGPDAPLYGKHAAANIVRAATSAGATGILHVTVMGAFRWSPARLNRMSFHLDERVRSLAGPWGLLRISCYFDEIIEGHVWPPDGGAPHVFRSASRYAPVSRTEAARSILDHLVTLVPGRAPCMGGAHAYSGEALNRMVRPLVRNTRRRRTAFAALPPGDISVEPMTTRSTLGWVPTDRLETVLDLLVPHASRSNARDPAPVYAKRNPGPHPADLEQDTPALAAMRPDLRRVVHQQLVEDLARFHAPNGVVRLDFSRARRKQRAESAHGGEMSEMTGVAAIDGSGQEVHRGRVDFLRDTLAEEFHIWWAGEGIPARVWDHLDMGVRRRLVKDTHFGKDPRVKAFASGAPEAV